MNFLIDGHETVFRELEQTIREGKSLAFVGSGVSKHAGYPLWNELMEQLAQAADLTLSPDDKEAEGVRLIEVVQECKERMGEARYHEELRKIFDPDLRDPISFLHVQILEMPFAAFPTTNVDNCHVLAKGNLRQGKVDADWDVFPVFHFECLTQRRVFYLHGKIEKDDRIRSIVLATSEYQHAYKTDGAAREFLFYVLRRFDCVFIGYSMSDVFMAKVIEEAGKVQRLEGQELERQGRPAPRQPKHYAILPRHVAPEGKVYIPQGRGRAVSPDEIERLELQRLEREELLKQLRITPLYYRVVHDNYSTLNQLIYQLNRQLVTDIEQVPT